MGKMPAGNFSIRFGVIIRLNSRSVEENENTTMRK